MKKFKRYLYELAMTRSRLELRDNTSFKMEIRIYTTDTYFDFQARKYTADEFFGTYGYSSSFLRNLFNNPYDQLKKRLYEWKPWEIMFFDEYDGWMQNPTQGKDTALQVFAAIEQAFMAFLKTKKPTGLFFTADLGELSRIKLYTLLAKKISRKMKNTYFLVPEFEGGGHHYYVFMPKSFENDYKEWKEKMKRDLERLKS